MSTTMALGPTDSSLPDRIRAQHSSKKWAHASRAVCIVVDQALVSATNFFTTLIVGRMCLPNDLGKYALGMSVIFALMNIPRSVVWTPHTNRRPRLKADQVATYTGSALVQTTVVALLLSGLLAILGIGMFWTSTASPLGMLLIGLAPVCGSMILREHARQIALASLRLRTVLMFDIAMAVLQGGGLLLLAGVGVLTVGNAYLVISAACLATFMFWQLLNRHQTVVCPRLLRLHVLQDWRLSKWVVMGAVVAATGEGLYPWLLALFHSSASVGVMTVCVSLVALANPLLVSLTNFSGPTMAHAYASGGIPRLRQTLLLISLAMMGTVFLFIALIAAWGAEVIELLYGSTYSGQKHVALALALPLVARGLLIPLGFGLLALERGDLVLRGSLVFLAATLTIGLVCVYRWGPAGVGYGSFIAGACVVVVQWTAFIALSRERTIGVELPPA